MPLSKTEWTRNGNKELESVLELFNHSDRMIEDYENYCLAFGSEFNLNKYLKMLDIHAHYMIAKAIFDHPEFYTDQLFKAFNSGQRIQVDANIDGQVMTNTHPEEF